ncbi:hypothetical protein LTR66_006596 [Elasticomyces elasticus]|nr:hypothetical protein LTR66_006596 [Elasticomyces elasticus]
MTEIYPPSPSAFSSDDPTPLNPVEANAPKPDSRRTPGSKKTQKSKAVDGSAVAKTKQTKSRNGSPPIPASVLVPANDILSGCSGKQHQAPSVVCIQSVAPQARAGLSKEPFRLTEPLPTPSAETSMPCELSPPHHRPWMLFGQHSAKTDDTELDAYLPKLSKRSPMLVDLLTCSRNPQPVPEGSPEALVLERTEAPIVRTGELAESQDDAEDIVRQRLPGSGTEDWMPCFASPTSSSSSGSSDTPQGCQADTLDNLSNLQHPFDQIGYSPYFQNDSAEMMTLHFNHQTCGILSIKDGPSENPWRTYVWPMAVNNPALFHAVTAMTSFHDSRKSSILRPHGLSHFNESIRILSASLPLMPWDVAIATTLTLGFAETWDLPTRSGWDHIKGAKLCINGALARHLSIPFRGRELQKLKFLCNTWIYMDVIARLTSLNDDDDDSVFDLIASLDSVSPNFTTRSDFSFCPLMPVNMDVDVQVDPLMGCGMHLFPIIGKVANLVRRVRRSNSNSPVIVSQARKLQTALQVWYPPSFIAAPEDPSSQIQHCIQTAEAYRWATLLYLHQAVPEIPSPSSAELAKNAMLCLAAVPLSSPCVIVQIYPLIAAGCEASAEKERQLVRERWSTMATRMKIGVIDRCADVVKEVWGRRDEYEAQLARWRLFALAGVGTGTNMPTPPRKGSLLPGEDLENIGKALLCLDTPNATSAKVRAMPVTSNALYRRSRDERENDETGSFDFEYSVRGRLHWASVIRGWKWEGSFFHTTVMSAGR